MEERPFENLQWSLIDRLRVDRRHLRKTRVQREPVSIDCFAKNDCSVHLDLAGLQFALELVKVFHPYPEKNQRVQFGIGQIGKASREGLDQEPVDRTGLVQAFALHGEIQVAVVLNGVAVSVEQRRVPVA